MKKIIDAFWKWYEEHYLFALTVTTFLFLLQIFHLYWLFTDVVLQKISGKSYFLFPPFWGTLSTVLDYTEIPALISTSLIYVRQQRLNFKIKNLLYLFLLNIQWIHLFWITDEIVVERFTNASGLLHWPSIIAWIAILIDYGEVPVMYDTLKQTFFSWKQYLKK